MSNTLFELDTSELMFRLPPYVCNRDTMKDLYLQVMACANHLGQQPISVELGYAGSVRAIKSFDWVSEQLEINDFLNEYHKMLSSIGIMFRHKMPNANSDTVMIYDKNNLYIYYYILFNTESHIYGSVLRMKINEAFLDGDALGMCYPSGPYYYTCYGRFSSTVMGKPLAQFVEDSAIIYELVKKWMDALHAEECWGLADNQVWTEIEYGGFHYTECAFRFTRSGPQYVDLSLEEATRISNFGAVERLRSEFPNDPYIESISSVDRPLGRVIDATWEEYKEMRAKGIKPKMRFFEKKKLYLEPDAIMPEVVARAKRYELLQANIKSGKCNYDEGFMSLD